ncbi:MAG TPA: 4-alpha-glucanotransferase [Thermoanaerobaculia bacterium]|nr:4-alpha-glucanotransferase [Thermoanaerobaculia bacterium]
MSEDRREPQGGREREQHDLRQLAALYGVEPGYHDIYGRHVEASTESLLAAASALAGPFEGMEDVAEALAARRAELAARLIEPVLVAWDGHLGEIELRLPGAAGGGGGGGGAVACHLDLESGERRAWTWDLDCLPATAPERRRLALPEALPPGYHHLEVKLGGRSARALVIAAPVRAFAGDGRPLWGVFLPLYALRGERSWGAGDLTDLAALAAWTARLGGGVVATLPLLATFLDMPCDPSPYAPVSRRFWNELYLDPQQLPEAHLCPAARRLLESSELQAEMRALAALPLVDYPRLAMLKRRVLDEMVAWSFTNPGPRHHDLERFVAARPELADYAAFRAVGDRRGESWQAWPERLRAGSLAPADYDLEDYRYHLWVQWAMEQQMEQVSRQARGGGPEGGGDAAPRGLYLDMPLGVHGSAYDVWRERDLFADGATAGAPPDSLFTRGQDWGFPPLRPERQRERGYDYLIASLRHHLRHAGVLRLDHVMQLHRLFWVPRGLGPAGGVYVRYPHEELYAVLALESHRHQAMIVGENLGTVPPEVNAAMARHGVLGMYVMQYELAPGGGLQHEPAPASVACLNTHDMPTFRGFWEGRDVDELQALGLLDEREAREERERREAQRRQLVAAAARQGGVAAGSGDLYPRVLHGCLEHLAAGPARMVLVNLEDLWQETEPQNVPGTTSQRPNWRRKARLTCAEMTSRPEVVETLARLDRLRRGAPES